MNFRGRYSVLLGGLAIFLLVFFMPWEQSKRYKRCLDCSELLKDIESLPVLHSDLVVLPSHEIGNKSFDELRVLKLKKLLEEQKEINDLNALADQGRKSSAIGGFTRKDVILDCVTWDIKWPKTSMETQLWMESNNTDKMGNVTVFKTRQNSRLKHVNKLKDTLSSSLLHRDSNGRAAVLTEMATVVAALYVLVTKLKAHLGKKTITIVDVFCGDVHWMSSFLKVRTDVEYTGLDILPEVIASNEKLKSENVEFHLYDFLKSAIQKDYDLVLALGTQEFLSVADMIKFLTNIGSSKSKYLLLEAGSEKTDGLQSDYLGDFKRDVMLKMQLSPVLLEDPVCTVNTTTDSYLSLWELPLRRQKSVHS